MRTFWYAGLLLLAGIFIFACQSGNLTVGQSVINPQELVIQSVDSVTIKTSTVMRTDSFVTSSDDNLVVGNWSDPQTGKLTAKTYSSVDFSSNPLNGQTGYKLDSLVLELGYSFVYGDTTSLFNVKVYRLNKKLLSQTYYNVDSVAHESTPFLQKTVYPQPNTLLKQVRIKLPDDVATNFYNQLQNGTITDQNTLSEFFPGFALAGTSSTNAFVGFVANSTSASSSTVGTGIRLYYHSVTGTDLSTTSSSIQFPIVATRFTQLKKDLSGTPLAALKSRPDIISSTKTNNSSFISLGTGLQTRIEFPYLDQFTLPDKFADLNSAILVFGPIRRDFRDNYPPPSTLGLYYTNNVNDVLSTAIPGGPSGTISATGGYTYDQSALTLLDYYTIDLTYYIGQIIKRKAPNRPLMFTFPITTAPTLKQLIQRVSLGNQYYPDVNDRVKLKLFITSGV